MAHHIKAIRSGVHLHPQKQETGHIHARAVIITIITAVRKVPVRIALHARIPVVHAPVFLREEAASVLLLEVVLHAQPEAVRAEDEIE